MPAQYIMKSYSKLKFGIVTVLKIAFNSYTGNWCTPINNRKRRWETVYSKLFYCETRQLLTIIWTYRLPTSSKDSVSYLSTEFIFWKKKKMIIFVIYFWTKNGKTFYTETTRFFFWKKKITHRVFKIFSKDA